MSCLPKFIIFIAFFTFVTEGFGVSMVSVGKVTDNTRKWKIEKKQEVNYYVSGDETFPAGNLDTFFLISKNKKSGKEYNLFYHVNSVGLLKRKNLTKVSIQIFYQKCINPWYRWKN